MKREREKKREIERDSFEILYTGYLLSIVKIKREIEREKEERDRKEKGKRKERERKDIGKRERKKRKREREKERKVDYIKLSLEIITQNHRLVY